MKKFLKSLAEFFNPRDWLPTFPIVRKHNPKAKGYQTFSDAIRGFPRKGE